MLILTPYPRPHQYHDHVLLGENVVDYSEQIPHTALPSREGPVQILKGHEILPHLNIFNVFICLYIDTPNTNIGH